MPEKAPAAPSAQPRANDTGVHAHGTSIVRRVEGPVAVQPGGVARPTGRPGEGLQWFVGLRKV